MRISVTLNSEVKSNNFHVKSYHCGPGPLGTDWTHLLIYGNHNQPGHKTKLYIRVQILGNSLCLFSPCLSLPSVLKIISWLSFTSQSRIIFPIAFFTPPNSHHCLIIHWKRRSGWPKDLLLSSVCSPQELCLVLLSLEAHTFLTISSKRLLLLAFSLMNSDVVFLVIFLFSLQLAISVFPESICMSWMFLLLSGRCPVI